MYGGEFAIFASSFLVNRDS
ncbi:Protein of unknown function [Bacillus wiedmannii]|uniref:Uncharacterized protein n=1 Tax=Bacillus wiedmannii TaxID=1890302 RepID=A0AB37YZN1_9BACI|nr:Protein of unknown function [Bacillus wiedmannii]